MEAKSSARRLKARDAENTALDLRRIGYTYSQIGKQMGCAKETAYLRVKRALNRLNEEINEKAEELRQLELQRYDLYLERLSEKIMQGDVKAIQTALNISFHRRKLLGLDLQSEAQEQLDAHTAKILNDILYRLNGVCKSAHT